ncbi:MAG TPA: hypothetical protein ENI95_10535, partial [Chloroflexi bacterium]|nr:hypothetical protein [Chloroflexota bacterium]
MKHRTPTRTLFALTVILLLAAALRIYRLGDIPPGLQHDEVFHAHDAYTVQQGYRPLWFTSNAGNEPLFIYLMAVSTALFGGNVLGIRYPAVVCGLLTLVFTYRWARLAFGRRVALMAALLMAVGFWPLWMSRVGLRAVSLPPLVALTGWLYLRAMLLPDGKRQMWRFALAGLALGLTLYTYPAAFAAPLVFAALTAYLAIWGRETLRRTWRGQIAFWPAAGLAYLPLGVALARAGGGYLRVQQTAIPLRALREGDPGPLLDATRKTLLMWTTRGDPLWRYNVASRPVFDPLLAVIFLIGVAICLWIALLIRAARSQRILLLPGGREDRLPLACALVVLWLGIGMIPSAVTDSPPAFLRASPALPATYLAAAVGFEALRGLLLRLYQMSQPGHPGGPVRWWAALVIVAAGLTTVETARAYFVIWPNNAEVQRVYRSDLAAIAAYLRSHDPPGGVAISTTEPHHLDRFIFDYTPHGEVEDIHWFDGLYALVAPAGDDPAWLFVTIEPVPGERLRRAYLDRLPLIEERRFPNGSLAFSLYAIPPGEDFLEQFPPPTEQGVWVADPLAFPPDDPEGIRTPLGYPVQFGEVAQLVGYEAATTGQPGEWLPLSLIWRVTQNVTTPEPWALFAHLLNAQGEMVAGR